MQAFVHKVKFDVHLNWEIKNFCNFKFSIETQEKQNKKSGKQKIKTLLRLNCQENIERSMSNGQSND
jgi:hypothetical protein